jgi:hypothetical protein
MLGLCSLYGEMHTSGRSHRRAHWLVVIVIYPGSACESRLSQTPPVPLASSPPSAASVPAPLLGFARDSKECATCGQELLPNGACRALSASCLADADCRRALACFDRCSGSRTCITHCVEAHFASEKTQRLAGDYLYCACCRSDCNLACDKTCSSYRDTVYGPVGAGCQLPALAGASGACNRCLASSLRLFDSRSYAACVLESDSCRAFTECADDCRSSADRKRCLKQCRVSMPSDGSQADDYLTEVCCGRCAESCTTVCDGVQCSAPNRRRP